MFLLSDVLTYIRRIIKSPSNAQITDNLIIDYINRFYISDVDARVQLFDLKQKYQFQTTPAWDRYNMPLYSVQSEGGQSVGMYPVYQGFLGPAYINGIQVPLQTQKQYFYNTYPNIVQNMAVVATGNDTAGPYTLTLPIAPNAVIPPNPPFNGIIRGHVDITGIMSTNANIDPPLANDPGSPTFASLLALIPTTSIDSAVYITSTDATGANVVVADSGVFLEDFVNYGCLMQPGAAPNGNQVLPGGYSTTSNTFNYLNGTCTVTFNTVIPAGVDINAQCFYFQGGLPREIMFYNNVLTLRSPPAMQYLVELDAYLSPCAFFNTGQAVQFGYMCEYIARGAARKILSDTGDFDQFQFYEPLFREQEMLVWKRSQRQFTSNRTETLYSQGFSTSLGGGLGTGGNNA